MPGEHETPSDVLEALRSAWRDGPPPPELTAFITDDVRSDPDALFRVIQADALERRRVRALEAWRAEETFAGVAHYEALGIALEHGSPLLRWLIQQ